MSVKKIEQPIALFWSQRQLAAHLGCSIATLQRWRRIGTGPEYRRIGAAIRYRVDDVRAWLDKQPAYRSRGDEIAREGGGA
jgi:predicted DNA-binding transcriptional regulator AlpA